MYYVYILKSKNFDILYLGLTNNLTKRFKEHNLGLSKFTKKYRPWTMVYFEGYASFEDAKDRERKLKQFGKVYAQLKT
jgi:putative endonuclease